MVLADARTSGPGPRGTGEETKTIGSFQESVTYVVNVLLEAHEDELLVLRAENRRLEQEVLGCGSKLANGYPQLPNPSLDCGPRKLFAALEDTHDVKPQVARKEHTGASLESTLPRDFARKEQTGGSLAPSSPRDCIQTERTGESCASRTPSGFVGKERTGGSLSSRTPLEKCIPLPQVEPNSCWESEEADHDEFDLPMPPCDDHVRVVHHRRMCGGFYLEDDLGSGASPSSPAGSMRRVYDTHSPSPSAPPTRDGTQEIWSVAGDDVKEDCETAKNENSRPAKEFMNGGSMHDAAHCCEPDDLCACGDIAAVPSTAQSISEEKAVNDADGNDGGSTSGSSQQRKSRGDRKGFFDLESEEEEEEAPPTQGLRAQALELTKSMKFEMFFAAVIFSNSAWMGFQMDIECQSRLSGSSNDRDPIAFTVVNYLYNVLFTVELMLRMLAEGKGFFCSKKNWHWNYLDSFIVSSSVAEVIFDIIYWTSAASKAETGTTVSQVRLVRFMRISRLMRVFRVARIVRFVRALRTLIYSIICTLKSVFWALLLLFIIMYVFGMVFASIVSDYIEKNYYNDDVDLIGLKEFWGTLPRSMFTLFKTIAGGISWHDVVTPLSDLDGMWVCAFVGYVAFTFFAVLNVITGVFCESAIDAAKHDQEMVIAQHVANKRAYIHKVRKLFKDIDADDSNCISMQEFEEHMNNEESSAFFATLELEVKDACEIFTLIDTDEGGSVDVDEFVEGCLQLRGQARSIDVARAAYENRSFFKETLAKMQEVDERLTNMVLSIEPAVLSDTASLAQKLRAAQALQATMVSEHGKPVGQTASKISQSRQKGRKREPSNRETSKRETSKRETSKRKETYL